MLLSVAMGPLSTLGVIFSAHPLDFSGLEGLCCGVSLVVVLSLVAVCPLCYLLSWLHYNTVFLVSQVL